jgi:hypothetical protein
MDVSDPNKTSVRPFLIVEYDCEDAADTHFSGDSF